MTTVNSQLQKSGCSRREQMQEPYYYSVKIKPRFFHSEVETRDTSADFPQTLCRLPLPLMVGLTVPHLELQDDACLCLSYPPSPLHTWTEVTLHSLHAARHQPSLTAQRRTTGPSLRAVHNILTLLQLPCSLPGLALPSTRRANSTDNRKTALTAEEGSGSSLTGHQRDTLQNACLPDECWAPTRPSFDH